MAKSGEVLPVRILYFDGMFLIGKFDEEREVLFEPLVLVVRGNTVGYTEFGFGLAEKEVYFKGGGYLMVSPSSEAMEGYEKALFELRAKKSGITLASSLPPRREN
ncbi:MAG: hypothetical protein QW835_00040 [Candidatus Hadarchaeum sp.]